MTKRHCPNCSAVVVKHPDNGCVLNALVMVARARGDTPEPKLRRLHANADADVLWLDIGRIVDKLAAGYYDYKEK